jgi:hypothetical protein
MIFSVLPQRSYVERSITYLSLPIIITIAVYVEGELVEFELRVPRMDFVLSGPTAEFTHSAGRLKFELSEAEIGAEIKTPKTRVR